MSGPYIVNFRPVVARIVALQVIAVDTSDVDAEAVLVMTARGMAEEHLLDRVIDKTPFKGTKKGLDGIVIKGLLQASPKSFDHSSIRVMGIQEYVSKNLEA